MKIYKIELNREIIKRQSVGMEQKEIMSLEKELKAVFVGIRRGKTVVAEEIIYCFHSVDMTAVLA